MPIRHLPNDDKARLGRIGSTGLDAPISLRETCERVFNGAISVATLKAEARRGNLVISKIGRAYFTTEQAIQDMITKCRVLAQAPTSGSTKPEINGQSLTANVTSARASLRAMLGKRSKP
jgi:hypothetical protein